MTTQRVTCDTLLLTRLNYNLRMKWEDLKFSFELSYQIKLQLADGMGRPDILIGATEIDIPHGLYNLLEGTVVLRRAKIGLRVFRDGSEEELLRTSPSFLNYVS